MQQNFLKLNSFMKLFVSIQMIRVVVQESLFLGVVTTDKFDLVR
jgi:hypothetical protein